LIMRYPVWICYLLHDMFDHEMYVCPYYLRHDLFYHEIACVAMVMLSVGWSTIPCEYFPCHLRWMDVLDTIT
jgi:hypothetical protein